MFEQMGKAGLAFWFMLRTDIIPHRYRDNRGLAVGVNNDSQSIFQRKLLMGNVDLFHQRRRRNRRGVRGKRR